MKIIPMTALRLGKGEDLEVVLPGHPVDVSDKEGQRLIGRGLSKADESSVVNPADLNDAIIDAIGDLSPDLFGKDGKPNVKAIESVLEHDITAADRDKAWDAYQNLMQDDRQ